MKLKLFCARLVTGALFASAVTGPTLLASTAWADDEVFEEPSEVPLEEPAEEVFGERGQLVPAGSLSLYRFAQTAPDGTSTSEVRITATPGLSVFVARNFLLGLALYYNSLSPSEGRQWSSLGATLQVGYNVRLSNKVSLLPQLSFALSGTTGTLDADTVKYRTTTASAYLPILWHVAPHFFIGIGPDYQTDLTATVESSGSESPSNKNSWLGVATTIGGWL